MPTAPENATAIAMITGEIVVSHPVKCPTSFALITPNARPAMPPRIAMTTLSTRNCGNTSEPRAPMAMRMPISRVLSVTDTSMMFMMPMPPTSSEIEAIAASNIVITFVLLAAVWARSFWFLTVKSSLVPSVLCASRKIEVISSSAGAMSCELLVPARIWGMKLRPDSAVDAVVYGISTTSSESLPLAFCPFTDSTPTTR